jgi:hypothetical protein
VKALLKAKAPLKVKAIKAKRATKTKKTGQVKARKPETRAKIAQGVSVFMRSSESFVPKYRKKRLTTVDLATPLRANLPLFKQCLASRPNGNKKYWGIS